MAFVLLCDSIARRNVMFPSRNFLHTVMGILFLTLRLFYLFKSNSH